VLQLAILKKLDHLSQLLCLFSKVSFCKVKKLFFLFNHVLIINHMAHKLEPDKIVSSLIHQFHHTSQLQVNALNVKTV